ncbi:Ankyrin repeat domain-containing protein 50 [Durusdinium trenchii]|uniref:Ankyrin repeat domain-containing protein 50 n=1 Tax=Durusdinium trenchii TaxID=1381693 RepID=A0ABP0IN82_9DINO
MIGEWTVADGCGRPLIRTSQGPSGASTFASCRKLSDHDFDLQSELALGLVKSRKGGMELGDLAALEMELTKWRGQVLSERFGDCKGVVEAVASVSVNMAKERLVTWRAVDHTWKACQRLFRALKEAQLTKPGNSAERKPRAELQPHDLCRAALQGDIRLAGWALERHNPDAEAKKGWTALHLAAAGGHQDIARALLKQQAQVDQAMPVSALSLACLTGKRDVVELLISALAQLDGPDGNGGAPLLHAAYKNRLPICQLLLDSDASAQVSFGPAGASRLAPVRRLRGEGGEGSPRWQEVLCESGFTRLEELQYCEGITALHLAAWHGNASLCLALLDAHARPNAQDSVGRTAISLAAQRGHLQSTMLLLEHRAQPQTADATGSTAVGWAAKMGQKPVVELLLEKMSIDFVPWLGAPTMLHLAAYHGRQGVVAMLLAAERRRESSTWRHSPSHGGRLPRLGGDLPAADLKPCSCESEG